MEQFLAEEKGIKVSAPYDMDTVTTNARISLAEGDRVAIVLNVGDSAASVADFTINQHDAATAGNTKVLATLNPYYKKVGAATKFTKVAPTVATSNYVLTADLATEPGVIVFEVLSEDLDNENGYGYISIAAADATVAKLLGITYVVGNMRSKPAYSIDL